MKRVLLVAALGACATPELERSESRPCSAEAGSCQATCQAFVNCVTAGGSAADCSVSCEEGGTPCETAAERADRHVRVAARRRDGLPDPIVMVHRVMPELGFETGLDGYRVDLELGADGHDRDIRATADVMVTFHDDFSDQHLEALGAVEDRTYAELQETRLRRPELVGTGARAPSLVEVLVVHQRHAGLMHLDMKTAGQRRGARRAARRARSLGPGHHRQPEQPTCRPWLGPPAPAVRQSTDNRTHRHHRHLPQSQRPGTLAPPS
jgi:hypothetical protein